MAMEVPNVEYLVDEPRYLTIGLLVDLQYGNIMISPRKY